MNIITISKMLINPPKSMVQTKYFQMSYHITRKTEDAALLQNSNKREVAMHPMNTAITANFGGAYIPEMLHRNVEELRTQYLEIMYEAAFQKEYQQLLQDYVGRPTPLYFAERLSKKHGTQDFFKAGRSLSYRCA